MSRQASSYNVRKRGTREPRVPVRTDNGFLVPKPQLLFINRLNLIGNALVKLTPQNH